MGSQHQGRFDALGVWIGTLHSTQPGAASSSRSASTRSALEAHALLGLTTA